MEARRGPRDHSHPAATAPGGKPRSQFGRRRPICRQNGVLAFGHCRLYCGPADRCHCRHPNLARATPPLRPDVIFGNDSGRPCDKVGGEGSDNRSIGLEDQARRLEQAVSTLALEKRLVSAGPLSTDQNETIATSVDRRCSRVEMRRRTQRLAVEAGCQLRDCYAGRLDKHA